MAPPRSPPPVRAALFDMDGLLIDSEDLYTICTNTVLQENGRPNLPWHIKAQLQGRPGPEASRILSEWAKLPISHEAYLKRVQALQKELFPSTKPLPGVPSLLKTLAATSRPKVEIALATSSHSVNFHLKTDHLQDLFSVFPKEQVVLGDDPRIPPGKGKPAPDIYLLALKTINDRLKAEGSKGDISPEECLVFEDSVPGVEAGRRAGMQVVWCPHPGLLQEYRGKEKEVLAGLTGESQRHIRPDAKLTDHVDVGATGSIDDGWAILVKTLEDFPYQRYGIQVQPTSRV